MSEMIDQVAEALYNLQPAVKAMYPPIPISWAETGEHWKEPFRNFARVAIQAMREPTEAMICCEARTPAGFVPYPETCDVVWHAMIDAALK